MSSSTTTPRKVCVQCSYQESPATFDLDATTSSLSAFYDALKQCYPHLPPPFVNSRPSFSLVYLDEDGDAIELESASDVSDAMSQALARSPAILEITVRPPTHLAQSSLFNEQPWETVKVDSPLIVAQKPEPVAEPSPLASIPPSSPVVAPTSLPPQISFDESLRVFLAAHLPMPSESQKIEVLMNQFANEYHATHPGQFRSADTAMVLAFSAIMLNTDLHNPQVKNKMTKHQFLRANLQIDDGHDINPSLLSEIYDRVAKNEIKADEAPPAVVAEQKAPEPAKPVVSEPASSPSSSSWSIFGLFGSSAAPKPATPAVAAPVVDVSPIIEVAPVVASASPAIEAVNPSVSRSNSSVSIASSSSASQKQEAEKEFWELDSKDLAQNGSLSNSFVSAMDAKYLGGSDVIVDESHKDIFDSTELTGDVLSRVLTQMIARTEDRLGLPSSSASSSGSFVRQPHQALLFALGGLQVDQFEGVIDQFVEICAAHAAAKEAERARIEAEKIAAIEEEMRREAQRLAKEEAERLAQIAAEAEAARLIEEQRLRDEAAEREREALEREQAERAEIERLTRDLEARKAALMKEKPVAPSSVGHSSQPPPAIQVSSNNSQVARADDGAVVVPSIPIPVASPVAAPAFTAAQRFNAAMQELRDMGFTDDALNTYMLQKTNLDIAASLDWLMTDAATGGSLKAQLQQQQ